MGARTTTTTKARSARTKLTLTSGVRKSNSSSVTTEPTPPRSPDKYFWYTSSDNITRLVTSADSNLVPEQINSYAFNPSLFSQTSYPTSFPSGRTWPPTSISDLLCPLGSSCCECVGETPYETTFCTDRHCTHTLSAFSASTSLWQTSFQLRQTSTRGIGVFTLRPFKAKSILGWYAGEITTAESNPGGDYLMEMELGVIPTRVPANLPEDQSILIDASRKGNWTRFINHSCDPYAGFRIMRVGGTRIMAVQAARDIPAGVELSVSYGPEYYGKNTVKICACGAERCVGDKRRKAKEAREKAGRTRVKKCKRTRPE